MGRVTDLLPPPPPPPQMTLGKVCLLSPVVGKKKRKKEKLFCDYVICDYCKKTISKKPNVKVASGLSNRKHKRLYDGLADESPSKILELFT